MLTSPHPATPALATDTALHIGASWYPELWPEAEWERDVLRMRELGFTIVRSFEFAWYRCEPSPGAFDFAWIRRAMDICYRHGVRVIVGTPTAAPPAWLTSAHPDVLKTHHDGTRARHGVRKHGSHISRTYRRLCADFVTRMAEALADHPALHAWQIDNELGGFDYGAEAATLFRAWLARTYGTVEAMNAAWGLDLWSQAYSSFDQVVMPTAEVGSIEQPERHHPSLILAVARFQNEEWAAYVAAQADLIRTVTARLGQAQRPITTNMVGSLQTDWFAVNRGLDRVGHSMYHDLDHYPWLVFRHDRMRAEKSAPDGTPAPFWLLETAPNWSGGGQIWNIHHDAGGARAMTWLATALGSTMAVYWQWREHWAGQEMLHGTLVTADGKFRPGKEGMQRLAAEHRRCSDWLIAHPPARAGLGLLFSNENGWGLSMDPIADKFRYDGNFRDEVHGPLMAANWWRDVLTPDADFAGYRVLVASWLPLLNADHRARLAAFVRAGGRLVLGPVSGFRSAEWTAFTDRALGGLEELIGATVESRFPPHWVEDRLDVVFADGAPSTRTRQWCEGFQPTTGTAVAHYRYAHDRGGWGAGTAAIIRHKVGAGEVLTLGCPVDRPTWVRLIVGLCRDAGLAPVAEGDGHAVTIVPRAGRDGRIAGYAVVNMTEKTQIVTLPTAGTDLISGQACPARIELEPVGVRVIAW
jgi:beta-galactosidase